MSQNLNNETDSLTDGGDGNFAALKLTDVLAGLKSKTPDDPDGGWSTESSEGEDEEDEWEDDSDDDGHDFLGTTRMRAGRKGRKKARRIVRRLSGTETPPQPGSELAIQTLYEGPPKCDCCKNWVEDYPEDLRDDIEELTETKRKALVVRMAINHGDGKAVSLDSIVVQSASLRKTLGEVFKGYQGITPELKKLVFKAPLHCFHHRWAAFKDVVARQETQDPDAAAHSRLLLDFLDVEQRDTRNEIHDLDRNRVSTFDLLWAFFEPDQLVMRRMRRSSGRDGDHYRFYLIERYDYVKSMFGPGKFTVTLRYVDFDGKGFGFDTETVEIYQFDGTKPISDLPVFPAAFHPHEKEAKAVAIERGKIFRDLCAGGGVRYKAYSGLAKGNVDTEDGKKAVYVHVDGRVVIDPWTYFNKHPTDRTKLCALEAPSTGSKLQVHDDTRVNHRQTDEYDDDSADYDSDLDSFPSGYDNQEQWDDAKRRFAAEDQHVRDAGARNGREQALTDEHLLLCYTHVRAMSLKLKAWYELDVTGVREISWNDAAFPNLMVPDSYKRLILGFVEGMARQAGSSPEEGEEKVIFDDMIEGKGLGVIMLLRGGPGTGKTLTAEAVADKVRRPLYVLGAGELGWDPTTLEHELRGLVDVAERWRAVVLLDECDVFLQQRSATHLEHNEMVAVLLRTLERYRGILFMTTNRAETIDPAFHSRVHLTLSYPELGTEARRSIWRQFTTLDHLRTLPAPPAAASKKDDPSSSSPSSSPPRRGSVLRTATSSTSTTITEADCARLARLRLNGRQIKNVVQIATLLAAREGAGTGGAPLGMEHVQTVLETDDSCRDAVVEECTPDAGDGQGAWWGWLTGRLWGWWYG